MEEKQVNKEKNKEKRLKNLQMWKAGESGNPNGRGKGKRSFKTIYMEALKVLAEKNSTTPEKLEAEMVANAMIKARAGNFNFYKDLLDRTYGSAVQKTAMTDTEGEETVQQTTEGVDVDELAQKVAQELKKQKIK